MTDLWAIAYVLCMLASFVGLSVIRRASRLLHTSLTSITNAMSAIAVVSALLIGGGDYPSQIRTLAAIAVFSSMTSIVGGFLITGRVQKLFRTNDRRPEVSGTEARAASDATTASTSSLCCS